MRRSKACQELAKDILFMILGALIAVGLSRSGALDAAISLFGNAEVASFVAGIFFTSVFTIAPAAVALAHISDTASSWTVIFWGALGSVCGDLVLFLFIRDRFSDDLLRSLKPSLVKHILSSFHLGFLKYIAPIAGALIIASPLPDEFGLSLMGISRTRVIALIPVSFIGNILGIYSIVWFTHAI